MTKYWLCVTNEINWEKVQKLNIWGTRARFRKLIEQVDLGDELVFYVKPKRIGGIFKAVSNSYEDHKKIFSTKGFTGGNEETFPFRIRLERLTVPEDFLPFEQLIPKLNFIANKEKWGGYLLGRALIRLSEGDYNTMKAAVQHMQYSSDISFAH